MIILIGVTKHGLQVVGHVTFVYDNGVPNRIFLFLAIEIKREWLNRIHFKEYRILEPISRAEDGHLKMLPLGAKILFTAALVPDIPLHIIAAAYHATIYLSDLDVLLDPDNFITLQAYGWSLWPSTFLIMFLIGWIHPSTHLI
ncbi:hypothetical protein ACJX0J_030053, partial [Zea mays]